MSEFHAPPSPTPTPPPSFQQAPSLQRASLYKQHSWSPDMSREEVWRRRKGASKNRRRCKSVTEEDLDELRGCIELGFGFDSPEVDPRLSDTLPALELFHAVNKHYSDTVSKSTQSLSASSDCETTSSSPLGSPHGVFGPGETPQTMKTRLKQWAQVVGCSVRQSSFP